MNPLVWSAVRLALNIIGLIVILFYMATTFDSTEADASVIMFVWMAIVEFIVLRLRRENGSRGGSAHAGFVTVLALAAVAAVSHCADMIKNSRVFAWPMTVDQNIARLK